jgi:hypothetical protein
VHGKKKRKAKRHGEPYVRRTNFEGMAETEGEGGD